MATPDDETEAAPAPVEGDEAAPADAPPVVTGKTQIEDSFGRTFLVPDAKVAEAAKRGFKIETPAEKQDRLDEAKYSGVGNALKAGGAAAARTASFGLSDQALTKSGLVNPETLKGLEEHQPVADAIGTGVGVVAPALLGDEAGVAGLLNPVKAVSAIGHGAEGAAAAALPEAATTAGRILAKAGSKAAGSAVEGAFYGAGNVVSEEALGDPNLTAQSALAHVGMGALLGGAIGAASAPLGEALEAGAKSVSDKLKELPADLQDAAENRTLKAAGFQQSDISKLSDTQRTRIARRLLDQDLVKPGAKVDDVLENIRTNKAGTVKEAADLLSAADEARPIGDAPFVKGESSDIEAKTGGFDTKKALDRVNAELIDPMRSNPLRMKAVAEGLDTLQQLADEGPMSFADANKLKNDLGEGLFGGLDNKLKKRLGKQLEGIFNDELKTQVGEALGDAAEQRLRSAQANTADLITAEKAAQKGVARGIGNRSLSLTDHLVGMAGLGAAGPVGGAVAAIGNKLARERLPSLLAVGLDKLSSSELLQKLPGIISEHVEKVLSSGAAPSAVTAEITRRSAEDAALRGAHAELQKENQVSHLAALERSNHAVGQAIDNGATSLVRAHVKGGKTGRGEASAGIGNAFAKTPEAARSQFKKRMESIQTLGNNPDQLQQHLQNQTADLEPHAPQTASATQMATVRAVQFLQSKLPDHPKAGPLSQEWMPSSAEIATFNRSFEAVNNPASILKQASAGTLTPEAVEAVATVYPQLFQKMTSSLMDKMTDVKPEKIPYKSRMMLSLLLGQDMDGSLNPGVIQSRQMAYVTSRKNAPGDGAAAQPTGNASGASKLTLANRFQTPGQASAARDA